MEILKLLGVDLHGLVVQIIGFVLLVIVLQRFLYKPIFGVIDRRQKDIEETYSQLDADRAAMAATRKEYEDRLAGIENQARERIQAAVKEAQELRANIISDAHLQAETLLEKARTQADRDRDKAFQEMRTQIVELAIGAAGKVISDSLDAPRHKKIVDDFIGAVAVGSGSSNGTGPL